MSVMAVSGAAQTKTESLCVCGSGSIEIPVSTIW